MTDPFGLDPCSYNVSLLPGKNSPLSNPATANGVQNEITRIFGLAGLGINFTGNSPDFTLVIANSVPKGANIGASAIGNTPVMNEAVLSRGYVYASRLEEFDPATAQNSAFLGIGLGRAGSHEIGHYLLQLLGHTSSGLMQAGFSGGAWHVPDRTGQFAFTPAQVPVLQKDCKQRHPTPSPSEAPRRATSTIHYGQVVPGSGWDPFDLFQFIFPPPSPPPIEM